jgi:hypothetical protein
MRAVILILGDLYFIGSGMLPKGLALAVFLKVVVAGDFLDFIL